MKQRKFFALVFVLMLLFAGFVSAGCGGGGTLYNLPDNPESPDIPVPDVPEVPEVPESPDTPPVKNSISVQYAIGQISIGYQNGDNSEYVTKNLTLPVSIEGFSDLLIAWSSSNPRVITDSGVVNRQSSSTNVILTVKISDGLDTAERDFNLKVIRARTKTPEQIKDEITINGLDEIRQMNISNDDFQVSYTASRDRVTDIDGKYSDIIISNADDALDSVWSIHGILGLSDPYEELESSVITEDEYGGEYTFAQVYNGLRVYGRNLTVSSNNRGETDFITTNVLPTSLLDSANLNFRYTLEQAENIAKNFYSGNFSVRSGPAIKAVFSLEESTNNPVPVYIINIYGNTDENEYIDEALFVNALTGDVIFGNSNIRNAAIREGLNELDRLVSFEVIADYNENFEYMTTRIPEANTTIVLFNGTVGTIGDANLVRYSAGEPYNDKQQVSAYTNMIEVIKWWKSEFNRDSLDGQGMPVKVVTHERKNNWRDNAFWSPMYVAGADYAHLTGIYICDPSNDIRSNAVAIDVLTHESTHAVFDYRAGYDALPYQNATGAIDEGYADIFACIMTQQWLYARDVHANGSYSRNIENPHDTRAREVARRKDGRTKPIHYTELNIAKTWYERLAELIDSEAIDYGFVHLNNSLITYPAYLMKSYNMTWENLGKVWYKSMRMGYNATSDYHTVRRNVLRAAKKLQMTSNDIVIIKRAFNQVGIFAASGTLEGTISNYNRAKLQNVSVKARPYTIGNSGIEFGDAHETRTDSQGKFSFELPIGIYSIDITLSGYEHFNALQEIEEGVDNILNITLTESGNGKRSELYGTIRDAITGQMITGALIKIRHGYNIHTGYSSAECLSENDGSYTTPILVGYYTVEVSKEGYITSYKNDLTVPSDERILYDVVLSPITDLGKYRVTLQWDENPSDLDAHLIGKLSDGYYFHVYYVNKSAYDSAGNLIANLDHDDTQGRGFETITFDMQPGDKFKYYVHWYNGTGTWSDSNAVVNIYKSGQHIGTFSVPDVDARQPYWYVFELTSGMNPIQPANSEALRDSPPSVN